jgi:hypothetical protein
MLFPNRASAYHEAHRVLAPGGAFHFSVWDDVAHNQIPRIIARTVSEMFPDDPPHWIERAPHGYFDSATIARDVRAGGFAHVEIEHLELRPRMTSRSAGVRDRRCAMSSSRAMPRGSTTSRSAWPARCRRPSGPGRSTSRCVRS